MIMAMIMPAVLVMDVLVPMIVRVAVPVIMPVVSMPMVVAVIVPAATPVTVVVRARIDQRRRQSALDGQRRLARCRPRLECECHDLRTEPDVVHLP